MELLCAPAPVCADAKLRLSKSFKLKPEHNRPAPVSLRNIGGGGGGYHSLSANPKRCAWRCMHKWADAHSRPSDRLVAFTAPKTRRQDDLAAA